MAKQGKRQQRHSAEDAVFNRMLLWLAGAVVAELLILLVKHFYVDITGSDFSVAVAGALLAFFQVFQYVGLALLVVGIVWTVLFARSHRKLALPVVCTCVIGFVWLVSVVAYRMFDNGLRILMVLPAVFAVLVLIFFLYQREFFVNAVLTAGGLLALWLYRGYYQGNPALLVACFVVGWVILVVAAVLSVRVSKSGGMLGSLRIMPEKSGWLTTCITCVICAVAMLLGLLLGSTAAYYLIFVLVAWLFCQAVYFTVKLM